jgi:hypothetical protein
MAGNDQIAAIESDRAIDRNGSKAAIHNFYWASLASAN